MSRTHRPHSAGACVICVTHPQNEGLSRSGPGRKVLTMGVLRDTVGNFTICRITVVNSVHPLLDAEMVKAIANMPKWNPGTQRGKAGAREIQCTCQFQFELMEMTNLQEMLV